MRKGSFSALASLAEPQKSDVFLMSCPRRDARGNDTSYEPLERVSRFPGVPDLVGTAYFLKVELGGRKAPRVRRKLTPFVPLLPLWVISMLFLTFISRIIEVEKKIDSIYSLLQTAPILPSGLATPGSLPSGDSASRHSETSPYQSASPTANPTALNVTGPSLYGEDGSGAKDFIQMGIITIQEAEAVLDSSLVEYGGFPWVVFPSELPLNLFRRERPFLLLALLALASRKQTRLYEPLQSEFKKVLSNKVIMDGVPDLDSLQGLLVYLAW